MDWENLTLVQQFDVVLIHFMLIGQGIFVGLWLALPWWKEWIGRALMVKSVALLILILVALVNFWLYVLLDKDWRYAEVVAISSHVLILIGIWSQVVALQYEKRRADLDDNHVVGTAPH